MAFVAPDLNTNVSTIAQVNTNFTKIETALETLQNLIPRVSVQRQGGNLGWVDRQLRPDGLVGWDSFVPIIATDDSAFRIAHLAPSGKSAVVIDERIHESEESFAQDFSDIIASDGTYRVHFGVRSRGAPALDMHLEVWDTDNTQTLTLWRMDVEKSGAAWYVSNLRLNTTLLMDREAWGLVLNRTIPLTYQYAGDLPLETGRLPTGLLMPFDCEAVGAYVRLETMPDVYTDQVDVVIELDQILGTDYTNVLGGTATFTERDAVGTTKTITAATPEATLLTAGTYVYPNITSIDVPITDFAIRPGDLSITMLVREVFHELR